MDFFLFFDFQRLFAFYCLWFKVLGFRLRWILFCFFDFERLFAFYCLWFKALGFRLRCFFFLTSRVFLHFIASGLRPSGLGSDGFFWFCNVQRLFSKFKEITVLSLLTMNAKSSCGRRSISLRTCDSSWSSPQYVISAI